MQDSESTRQWQATCVCGWRTSGARGEVVSAVIAHGQKYPLPGPNGRAGDVAGSTDAIRRMTKYVG